MTTGFGFWGQSWLVPVALVVVSLAGVSLFLLAATKLELIFERGAHSSFLDEQPFAAQPRPRHIPRHARPSRLSLLRARLARAGLVRRLAIAWARTAL